MIISMTSFKEENSAFLRKLDFLLWRCGTRHRSTTTRQGRAVDLYLEQGSLLSPTKQAPLSSGLLSVSHDAKADEMGC